MSVIPCKWTGDTFEPLSRFLGLARAAYAENETYRMAEVADRSMNSHRHYFAAIKTAWETLPEEYGQEFPTPEHLRKWCLIKEGYCDRRSIVCNSKSEARKVAAFIRPMDEFAVVVVNEYTVTVLNAQSQSLKAMGKLAFQESKSAVLERLDAMVGVNTGDVSANAGTAA